jgi:PhzF family phenazine biosynthesis protein
MKIKIYQIDAFTERVFGGNPAAICPLNEWLPDEQLQNIAMENNLAETGFFVKKGNEYEIRWFTPKVEVDLCGHATLAAAHVLYNYQDHFSDEIIFNSHRSGILKVRRERDNITLNFPTDTLENIDFNPELTLAFDIMPVEILKGKTDYMFVFENEAQIRTLKIDLTAISKLKARGVIVTSKGEEVDFVSRFFAPQSGIDEDPVTGSAHTSLTPYWSEKFGKNELSAIQLSGRKGYLHCKSLKERTEISGKAITYMIGEIYLP